MQTFLPYESFIKSAQSLDYRRLGKQRVEAKQIFLSLMAIRSGEKYGWMNHPCIKMWYGYEYALLDYMSVMIDEWVRRGYKNTMDTYELRRTAGVYCPVEYVNPNWLGNPEFHLSHKSNLIRKAPDYYINQFGQISNELPYVWVVSDKWEK